MPRWLLILIGILAVIALVVFILANTAFHVKG